MTHTENDYQKQLDEKANRLSLMLSPFDAPSVDVFESAPSHYRMRAEFRVWHDGDDLFHIMFNQQTKQKYRVDTFPAACTTINDMMQILIYELKVISVLRAKLFQIDYLSGLSGEIVVSLLYHKPLDDAWNEAALSLKEKLSSKFKLSIIGRARKQKVVLGDDFIIEKLPINNKNYVFKHIENSFTQPNAQVNCRMIEWALEATQNSSTDLLELYCGAGNFSLPLAQNFRRVIGTEIAKPSVSAAQFNIQSNNIDNVDIVRLSAEEFVEAIRGDRKFSRLGDIDLESYQFDTVLVDPPRAGLDEESLKMIQAYSRIIYISCNPETLCDNLSSLTQTHTISKAALFDQFPFTHHMEAGVILDKKPA